MLQSRIAAGQPAGFVAGDVLTYIIQFTPVRNGANTGVAGYITDYIPGGTEVVGAAFVIRDSQGNFTPIAPGLPGGIDSGWGNRGQKTFLSPFNASSYDPTGRCAAGGYTNNCNARLTELHADTGIFYSTNSRTAVFPTLPTRIAQSSNGYNILPTAAGQLNPIIGQANATTHNLWDADQTNAFGTGSQANINGLLIPKSNALYLGNGGTGATPYLSGSAVAGPQTGYTLDNTGAVGPWNRIAYAGSRAGDASTGPATAADTSFTAIGGLPTNSGFDLSLSNPLPATTNAVRWAAGKLQVGEIKYVSISLRLTAMPPLSGIQNQSEVFGGDAADADNGQDNVWRYHVPSVADNNSNLYIYKEACQPDPSATNCQPLLGTALAAGTTVTYRITYINTGAAPQTNVVLRDLLPCYTGTNASIRVGAKTGPLPLTVPFVTTTASAGNCTSTPQTRYAVTFPMISSLAAGEGGSLIINIPNNASTLGDVVVNTARLSSDDVPSGVTSNAVTTIGNTSLPALALSKITTVPNTWPGGTTQYVVTLQNYGTGAAVGIQFDDFLPTAGGAVDATRRFNFSNVVSVQSNGLTTNTALVTATATAATTNALIPAVLEPYDTDSGAANRVRVNFNFGSNSQLAAGGLITLTFNVSVGANMPLSPPSYTNDIAARSTAGTLVRVDTNNAAPVNVMFMANLSLTKSNGTDTLIAGQTTTYTIIANNAGPSAANGAVLRDPAVLGLSCTQISCTPTGAGALCPAVLDVASLQGSGVVISSFPAGSSLTFQLVCGVTATGQAPS